MKSVRTKFRVLRVLEGGETGEGEKYGRFRSFALKKPNNADAQISLFSCSNEQESLYSSKQTYLFKNKGGLLGN